MTRTTQLKAPASPAALGAETVDELIACLDDQIDLLARREAELDALGEAILANDNDRMERVLDEMTRSRQLQQQADDRLSSARGAAAETLGWPASQTRLAKLIGLIEPTGRQELRRRRRQVLERASRISLKHRQTAVLLAECTRVNRMLIDCMVGDDQRVTLYGHTGRQHWNGAGGLMDTEQ